MDASPPWVQRGGGGGAGPGDGPAGGGGRGGLGAFGLCVNQSQGEDLGLREGWSLEQNQDALSGLLSSGRMGREQVGLALRKLKLRWRKQGALEQIPKLLKSAALHAWTAAPVQAGAGAGAGAQAGAQAGAAPRDAEPWPPAESEKDRLRRMSIRDLKLLLQSRGVDTQFALMKSDLVDLALKPAPTAAVHEPEWMPRGAAPTATASGGGKKRRKVSIVESDSEASPLRAAPSPSSRVLRNRNVCRVPRSSARATIVVDSDEESLDAASDDDDDAHGDDPDTEGEILDAFLLECKRMSETLEATVMKGGSECPTGDPEVAVLKDIPLKAYQREGVRWLLQMYKSGYGAVLGDEMGLGKTLQTISVLLALERRGVPGPHIVVLPNSLLDNWQCEFKRWAPSMTAVKYHGEERARLRGARRGKITFDVILVPFKLFDTNGDNAARDRSFLRKIKFGAMVLDEGHCIKDIASNRFRRLTALSMRWKLLLTGTIFQNRVRELISLLMFILPQSDGLSQQCTVKLRPDALPPFPSSLSLPPPPHALAHTPTSHIGGEADAEGLPPGGHGALQRDREA